MTRAQPTVAPGARRTIRTRIARLLITAAVAATAACSGSDSSTGPETKNHVGTYPLVQIDREPIPFVIYDAVEGFLTVEVTAGRLVLEDNGTFRLAIDYTTDWVGTDTRNTATIDGDYEIQGTSITLETPDGEGTGTLRDGNVITLSLDVAETGVMRQYAFKLAR